MTSLQRLIIVGSRGMGRDLASFIKQENAFNLVGFLDDHPDPNISEMGISCLGSVEAWTVSPDEVYIVAIGSPTAREYYVSLLESKGARFATYVSTRAIIGSCVHIEEGCCVLPNAIVTTHVKIGKHCILNVATSISHDCVLEDFITCSPGVNIAGYCTLHKGTFIGINATLLPRLELAKGMTIGAGSVVTRNFNIEHCVIAGVPAQLRNKHH